MKQTMTVLLAVLLTTTLTACAAGGQAPAPVSSPFPESPSSISEPAPEPPSSSESPVESSVPEEPSQPEKESVPAPEPDGLPLPPQGEVNPDFGWGDKNPDTAEIDPTAPDPGLESYAVVVTQRASKLWEALKPALTAIDEDYSRFEISVEDGSLNVVLEIGVIHEDKVDQFLENWTGPSWDKVIKSPGSWSVAQQQAFAAAVAKLDLGPGVVLYGERGLGVGESVMVTIRPDDTVDDPLAHWDDWRQAVKDFAKEQNAPVDMIDFMYVPSRYEAGDSNPDT